MGELDNRGSHYYLALYWAQALAGQKDDEALAQAFTPLAEALAGQEAGIVGQLNGAQGVPVDIGGYYRPSAEKCSKAMRPSTLFNDALGLIGSD